MTNNPQPSNPSTPPTTPQNDRAAERNAQVAPAAIAPIPLIQMTLSDPDALANVQRRAAQAKASRGRTSLRIPLASATNVSGGIAIPK